MTASQEEIASAGTVGELLRDEARRDPERPFLMCDSDWITLKELDERSDRVAAALQEMGVAKGDRVAINLPNRAEYVSLIYACAKAGAIQVPINIYLRGEFLKHQLAQSEASVLITDAEGLQQVTLIASELPRLKQFVLVGEAGPTPSTLNAIPYESLEASTAELDEPDVSSFDTCVIMYTSGTTGPSKGCIISHAYYNFIPQAFIRYGWCETGDIVFGATPLFHFSGQVWLVAMALAARGSVVVEPRFSATSFMRQARETGATVIFGMGAMAMAILAQPESDEDRNHKVRRATWIPMTVELQDAFEGRFGIPVISEVYGQSECWPATLSPVSGPRKPASLGRPIPGIQLRIVDGEDHELGPGRVGEIIVRSDQPGMLYDGYWNDPEGTTQAWRHLWHHTGDNGYLDEDGYLYFADRKKDSLRRRGENVSSIELEQAIAKHPAVARAAVHAVPSEMTEDDIKACIVLKPGYQVELVELFDFFKSSVPYYAIPRYVEFLDELPTNVNGRIQKFKLRERGITETTHDFDALGFTVARDERRA